MHWTIYSESLTFLSVDIQALALVDEAYQNRVEWIKKSISTTAKVGTPHIVPS